MSNLKSQTIKGVFWSFIEKFGSQLILLISQIVLARLLEPKDFGLLGMLAIFIAVSQAFIDSGFDNALIQKKEVNQTDYSTVFYFNITIGIVLYLILFFAAPLIADFFHQPLLVDLTRVVCIVLAVNSFGLIQFVKFKIEMNFKAIAQVVVIANLLSAFVGIAMALMGFGVWALAGQIIGIYFFRTVLFWIKSSWRPSFIFSFQSFKQLFSFGSKLLLSGIINQVFQNIYLMVIGRIFSASLLGFYTQAKKLQEVPVTTLAQVVGNVTFPAFSKIQDDNVKLREGFRKLIKLMVFINFPLMLGLAVVAEPLLVLILGEKWLPSVPYFQLLCIAGMIYTLHASNLNILKVKGRSDLFLYLEIIKKTIVVIAIFIGLNWGIIGLIVGQICTSFISFFINAFYTGKLISYTIPNQLKDISQTFFISLGMVAFMSIGWFINNQIISLVFQILIGIGSYLLLAIATKQEALTDGLLILKEVIPLRRWKNVKY
ncbi:MOP flippase family protein [Labilibaculum sp. DW002]|uniref:MOP flippase family protein n=1 Tax=Paralabilibaculum antarcticum TaxID=2912572 RepID=A0ABT5VSH2_9BACT|nr:MULTISPECIES: MOP flippase family protein [unclassified Labilibaculum]MBI9057169.1 MOP flippase family protein [Labilibaculum sp.]MDE5417463.1 MOP flippase family protein [Labilibaculum sp. DW002]